ncbi:MULTISPECIES: response regulator transcription factor [unclassified Streptomyces]|uniref:response regulator transcription factor n=1 Tax=unclassified Streptomyces TaxID=2593676 RepID=UPI003319543C
MSYDTALAHSFTPREREILSQLPNGDTYQAIARRLGLSPHTVDTYVRRLRGKTGTTNRTQLAVLATRLGFSSYGPAHPTPATAAPAPGTGL